MDLCPAMYDAARDSKLQLLQKLFTGRSPEELDELTGHVASAGGAAAHPPALLVGESGVHPQHAPATWTQ